MIAADPLAPPHSRWPHLARALAPLSLHGMFSLPLTIGPLRVGVVDLHADDSSTVTAAVLADAAVLAQLAAGEVLRHALEIRDDGTDDGPLTRREVHQATGMVIAQLRVPAVDALLLIRAHAYASGRSVRQVAADITARRLILEP